MCSLGTPPGVAKSAAAEKAPKRPLSDKDVSVQIRPPDATFLVCTKT